MYSEVSSHDREILSKVGMSATADSSDLEFCLVDQTDISTEQEEPKEVVTNIEVVPKSPGRRLKLYSWIYPYFGFYYCLRHPILIGPTLFLPVLQSGVTLAILYPILTNGLQGHTAFLKSYLANTRLQKYSWLIIATIWVLQKTWLNFFVFNKVLKYFARGLLLKVYTIVSNNYDTISLNYFKSLDTVLSNQRKLDYLCGKTVTLISMPEGEVPKIKSRPITTKLINFLYSSIILFLPKSKWSLTSFIWGSLIPGCFKLFLPPGIGSIMYSVVAGPIRAQNILQPYFKQTFLSGFNEKQAFIRTYSLSLRTFGISASLLESIPLFGPLFAFTNTVGAGIWLATYHPPLETKNIDVD